MQTTDAVKRPQESRVGQWVSEAPWWAIVLVATGLILGYLILADPDYRDTFFFLQAGVRTTLRITLTAYGIAVVVGLIGGLARTSKNVVIYNIATFYVEVVRGIPLIVLMLYVAFGGVPFMVQVIKAIGQWGMGLLGEGSFFASWATYSIRNIPMDMRAIFALALGYGAYEAEVFRAGIQSISRGQIEAARSLGMTYFQAMRFVILPQAVRRVLPPLGNDFISLLKDSSLATVLAVPELTQLGRLRRASTFRVYETFNVVSFLYLAMTLLLSTGVRALERRMRVME